MTLNRSDFFSCAVCGSFASSSALLPVWPSLDVLGHHRAACANAGVLGRRGWVLENVAARVCREAGGRSLSWQWTPTTMVCPLSRDGVAQRGTATTDGKSLARARRRKEMTYPELTGEHGRAGWWSWVSRSEAVGLLRPTCF